MEGGYNMGVFPYGAIASANVIIKRNEKEEKKRRERERNTSHLSITIDDENIKIEPNIKREFDWVRAAWALTQVCKQKGQMETLQNLLSQDEGKEE